MNYYNTTFHTTDYYPSGMPLPGRQYSSDKYRFGFNGQEKDNEVYGNGNLNTAQFWEYDTRLIRRWNVDPKPKVWESVYACFSNNPIWFSDVKGDTSLINGFSSRSTVKQKVGGEFSFYEVSNSFIKKVDNNDGIFILTAHGNNDRAQFDYEDGPSMQFLVPEDIIFVMRQRNSVFDEKMKNGESITLIMYSCKTANDIAKQISATYPNIKVIAPTTNVRYGKIDEKNRPTPQENGSYLTFVNGKEIKEISDVDFLGAIIDKVLNIFYDNESPKKKPSRK